MKRWLVLLLIGGLLAACGDRVPRLGALGTDDIVLAFGDSLTYGTGAKPEESYPAVLARLISRPVVRAGVPGERTDGGLQRIAGVLDEHRPKLVILCLGGNDMLRKVDKTVTENNLRAILREIRSRGVDAVLIGVPQPALVTSAPAFYEKLAKEFSIPYEAGIVTSVLYKPELKSDPIHPNAEGYRRIAEAVANLLRKAGAVK